MPARWANSAQRTGVISTEGSKALQGVSSSRMRPSLKKKSRISSRDNCWQEVPSRMKKRPPKAYGLLCCSGTVTSSTSPSLSISTATGGSAERATLCTWDFSRLWFATPTTVPASSTPIRMTPPVALAKAQSSLPRSEGRDRLNSVVNPSPREIRSDRVGFFILHYGSPDSSLSETEDRAGVSCQFPPGIARGPTVPIHRNTPGP